MFSVCLVAEGEDAIATRLARTHVPHDTSVGESTEGAEGFCEDVVIDFWAKITDKDVIVVAGVLFILLTLVGPVDTDLGVEDLASVEGLQGGLSSSHIHVFYESIV